MGINFSVRPKLSLTPSLPTGGHHHRHCYHLDLHHHHLWSVLWCLPKAWLNSHTHRRLQCDEWRLREQQGGNPNSKRRNIFQAIRYLTGQLENSPVVLVDTFRVVIWSFFYLKNQRLCIISRWNGFLHDHHFDILSSSGKWRKWGRNDFPGSWQDRLRPCRGFGQNQPHNQPTPPESYLQNSCYVCSPTNKDVYLQSMVTSAAVDRNNYGEASDHLPINAVLQMWSLKAKARSYLLWFVFSHHQLKCDLSSPVNSVLLQFFLFFVNLPQLVKCPPAVTPITDALHQNDCFYVSNVRNSTVTLSLIYWRSICVSWI